VFKRSNFIERSITGALSFLKESVFADEYSARKGFLQSLDPRVKVISLFLFILQVILTKSILVLWFLYVLCLLLASFSRIGLGFFLKRTWVFIPLFSVFIAIPAIFSVFSPGEAIAIIRIFGLDLLITRQGVNGAGLFLMRVISSVSFAILLSLTTRHFVILRVLRIFKIPQVFVMTLGIAYRYIYLFVEMLENTYQAIKSRVGNSIHYKRGQHIVAWNIAYLWSRSYQLNEEVYKAMLSRGYRGEPLILDDFKVKTKDWLWLIVVAIICTWII